MSIIKYLKQNGIKHTVQVLYRYKIDRVLLKVTNAFMKNKKLENIIILEGHNDFDSNAGAFYQYLLENEYNKKYKIVWLLKNKRINKLPKNVISCYLYKPSIKKNYYISRAKYILTCQDAIGSQREDQVTVYMTHGPVALKSAKGKCDLPANLTFCLMPSLNLMPALAEQYQFKNNHTKKVIIGYPMHDFFYDDSKGDLNKVTEKKFTKKILWMPTFRKGKSFKRNDSNIDLPLGIPLIRNEKEYKKLNKILENYDTLLIIKIHPMQDMNTVKIKSMSNIIVLDGESVRRLDVDNYRLMKDTDALISDYSSAAFDYLHLNRPIAFTVDDIKDYKLGFIIDDPIRLMGGNIITDISDIYLFIEQVHSENDIFNEKRNEVFNYVFKFHDGKSSERLLNLLESN